MLDRGLGDSETPANIENAMGGLYVLYECEGSGNQRDGLQNVVRDTEEFIHRDEAEIHFNRASIGT